LAIILLSVFSVRPNAELAVSKRAAERLAGRSFHCFGMAPASLARVVRENAEMSVWRMVSAALSGAIRRKFLSGVLER
jgi:hypothetical protein